MEGAGGGQWGDEVSVNVSCSGWGSVPLTFSLMSKDARLHLLNLRA